MEQVDRVQLLNVPAPTADTRQPCLRGSEFDSQRKAIEEFWRWAPEWMEKTGNSEKELLKQFPSFRGTKPRDRKLADVNGRRQV